MAALRLSSVCCCIFTGLYDLKMTIRGEMELAYYGEITTPSRCGRMDQCCAFGSRPVLMTFDGDLMETKPLVMGAPLHMVRVTLACASCLWDRVCLCVCG
jgi:hypothetical protein